VLSTHSRTSVRTGASSSQLADDLLSMHPGSIRHTPAFPRAAAALRLSSAARTFSTAVPAPVG